MKPTPLDLRREDYPDLTGPRLEKLLRALQSSVGSLVQAGSGKLTFKDNVQAAIREVTFTAKDPWIALSLTNGWTASTGPSGAPQYRVVGDEVQFRGLALAGTLSSPLATMPAGLRPGVRCTDIAEGATDSARSSVRVDVETDGDVVTTSAPASLAWVSLSGLRYAAAAPAPSPNPVFPVRVQNDLKTRPAGVWIWDATDITGGKSVPVSLGPVAWSVSEEFLVIEDIGAVVPDRKYRVKIVAVAG